ncbi:MAG: patB [Bacteroidetes bacterium]|nr:patB [Bacteroidota bacterium]
MKKYNFDAIINREGTNALKLDVLKQRYGRSDLIPMWVADMDFASPPCVKKAITARAEHGIFGYTCASEEYYQSIIKWVGRHHGWNIEQEWISFVPGIVKGIAFVIDCFTTEGDKVIIQPPVYHPFRIIPKLHHREVVYNELIFDGENYRMDFESLKQQAKTAKVLILCNPHNPGGRVWTKEELVQLAEICYDNKVLVISDEIHSDLALNGHKHVPFASVSEKAAENSITFMAPSKTFNIAGIVSSFSVVSNADLRDKFYNYLKASELEEGHIFAYLAAQAVYQDGDEWLLELKDYLWENICFTDQYLKKNFPQVKAVIPQASFLVWLDCRELGMSQKDLVSFFVNEAKLALNDGAVFGPGGNGFMRLNVGTPRSIVEKSLQQLVEAYIQHQ